MKFILRYTASGNEAIMQSKWGSSGTRGSLHIALDGTISLLPSLALSPPCWNQLSTYIPWGTTHQLLPP